MVRTPGNRGSLFYTLPPVEAVALPAFRGFSWKIPADVKLVLLPFAMELQQAYEIVIGLEVHVQLQTRSKLFCGDSTAYGAEPNTQVSPVTLAHPGTLPVMNRRAVEMAVKMGLSCHCRINRNNYFARKNYFYPDLPKGYQVSQYTTPVCEGGYVTILIEGEAKNIRLTRIHLEEDAGKSIHDADPDFTCIDFNRAGAPLIEIVSEPDLRTAAEAFTYLGEIRKLVRYLGISDGNMEEGSLRCDANISVRKMGDPRLGTRVEVKNLNSIRNLRRAIEFESQRLIKLHENGEPIIQQTRSFDANRGTTFATREKEDAEDYRYFADPDLSPIQLEESFIEQVRDSIPALQQERMANYTRKYQLSDYDARVLTEDIGIAEYFEAIIGQYEDTETESLQARAKAAANWVTGPVKSWLNERNCEIPDFPLSPARIAELIDLVSTGRVSFSVASSKLFNALLAEPGTDAVKILEKENLSQQSDVSVIEPIVDEVLLKYEDKVKEYRRGKKGLLSLFVGEVMKRSKGKADPKLTNELLLRKLNP